MPDSNAAAVTDNCAETTLRTATRCFDMRWTVTHIPTHQSPVRCHLCPGPRHLLASQPPQQVVVAAGSIPDRLWSPPLTNNPTVGSCAHLVISAHLVFK